MSAVDKHTGPPSPVGGYVVLVGVLVVGAGVADVGLHAGHDLSNLAAPPWNPIDLGTALAGGQVRPGLVDAIITGGLLLVVAGLLAVGYTAWSAWRGRHPDVDRAATHLGSGQQIRRITVKRATKQGRRLGFTNFRGLPLARLVPSGQELVSGPEDVMLTVAGPRVGWKTSAVVIRRILANPRGPVVTTANKPDSTFATRGPRAELGQVWVWDPQNVAGEPATWWWNPLTWVTSAARGQELATNFADAARDPNARTDDYFGPEGLMLLGNLLYAAALGGKQLTDVYAWTLNPRDDKPAHILKQAGLDAAAAEISALASLATRAVVDAPSKERAGLYGSARRIMSSFMLNETVIPWVTAQPGDARRHFDPDAFVRGPHTLYSLSREGVGSAAPLVAALTAAVCEAAMDYATACGGRLPEPMVVELDEATNVCPWRSLPAQYSHFGSRGILLNTVIQSPAQAIRVWGETGWAILLDAANVLFYGGGIRDSKFLELLSTLVGKFTRVTSSRTHSRHGSSSTVSVSREPILDVGDLGRLDETRAVILHHGGWAVLARKVQWFTDRKMAGPVNASLDKYDPGRTAFRRDPVPVVPDVPSPAETRSASPWARS